MFLIDEKVGLGQKLPQNGSGVHVENGVTASMVENGHVACLIAAHEKMIKSTLMTQLQQCCRKHHRMHDVPAAATTTLENQPLEPQSTGADDDSFSSADCLFNCNEEAESEAIVDTGASRAVIGETRLHGLIRSFPQDVQKQVHRAPTPGVVFKFGNATKLTSQYAVLLPRKEHGWIQVEVVPGSTPFLISNSILKGLRGLVDVEDQRLRFKCSDISIPLKTCRKHLLAVNVYELLTKSPHNPKVGVETIMHVDRDPCHHTSVHPSHFDTQHSKMVSQHETKVPASVDSLSCNLLNQDCHNQRLAISQDSNSESATNFDHGHGSCLLTGGTELGGRPALVAAQGAHVGFRRDQETPRCQESTRMGSTDCTIRQTCRTDLHRDVPGHSVRQPALESSRSVRMGSQFSDVLQSSPRGMCQGQETVEGGTADANSTTDSYGQTEIASGSSRDRVDLHPEHRGQESYQAISRRPERDTVHESGDHTGTGRESSAAAHSDRHPATRTREGDEPAGGPSSLQPRRGLSQIDSEVAHILSDQPLPCLSPHEEQLIHEALQNRIQGIENEFSELPCSSMFVSEGLRNRVKISKNTPNVQRKVTLLEVYCEPNSQLTHQVNLQKGRALRFTRNDGDLSTEDGRMKLWTWVHMYEPEHIWVAPDCRLWGNFSRYNMGRSTVLQNKILHERESERVHLQLCNDLYLHQVGQSRHFHLEQPFGSEMIFQNELNEVRLGTLPATFDMCQVGKLRLPQDPRYLQKRTQVFTTSRTMFNRLHQNVCPHAHQHTHIKGQTKIHGTWTNISEYAKRYTPVFSKKIASVLCQKGENPLLVDEMILGLEEHERPEMAPEALQLQKRRRLNGKRPESSLYGKAPCWKDIFRQAGHYTPRVGNAYFERDHVVSQLAQQLVPEMQIQIMIACRGTNRHRVLEATAHREKYPFRKTVLVDRDTGEIKETGPMEEWVKLPKLQQIRGTGSAKISLTMFGYSSADGEPVPGVVSTSASSVPKAEQEHEDVPDIAMPAPNLDEPSDHGPRSQLSDCKIEGWAPKIIPQSGPGFRSLSKDQQSELRRVHNNLGHPDPARMGKFLKERGATADVIAGAMDMQCDVCLESQPGPKKSQPGRIHPDLDFNDVVGGDGAYWTSGKGQKYHFMHFIDEATLYHVGVSSGRHFEEQVKAFETAWTQWAGPCRLLYLDPAGEYATDEWATYLQAENIRVSMTAAEAHWQNGRCEVHGRIIKEMLSRMDREVPVLNLTDFQRNLRHAFAAKNSLSRIHGFTPEQCLLGKARPLPGSLTADDDAASHLLAESDAPEGVRFRANLQRREAARKAFVQADNDSAFRRALLRRSRPGQVEYEAEDWVLYWRKAKGNSRNIRGRWHGPAQVITVEGTKVLWLSHLGRLIRASPEQVRPASLREYQHLPRNGNGEVINEKPVGKGVLALEDAPPPREFVEDSIGSPSIAPSVLEEPAETDTSQPEQEEFPNDVTPNDGSETNPEMEPCDVPVPHGDSGELGEMSEDDLLFAFGDDCPETENNSGVWEIELATVTDHDEVDILFSEDTTDLSAHVHLLEHVFLASNARKQKIEVQYRSLSERDQKLFDAAKDKEVKAWIDHGTVQKVAKGTLSPDQIMRCRWILTWKAPEPGGTERRAKARLVVLGFEDPGLSEIPRDAPTLSKDGRQLLLQMIASQQWGLLNFDISTAFLKGQGDGRALGLHAPKELQKAIGMKEPEQCLLKGGAYGRVDAPYLWYCELRKVLEGLGFVAAPFDNCLFTLVTPSNKGQPILRGVLGIHVDDGIGGGDWYFKETLQKLRDRFSFGAYNEYEFDFCGVHYKQWDDGTIEMDQREYIKKITPIDVPKNRRVEPEAILTETEKQHLRGLCGSLQFAAVHTRPDLAAKVGQLQSRIPRGQIKDLLEANKVLYEGKRHHVCLLVVPIAVHDVTFCAFSDASFSTAKDLSSRQGTLIFATEQRMSDNQRSVVCPIAWSSKKIPRVVTSTLSAEAMALSSTLDRLSFIRIFWEWIKDPSVDWANVEQVLSTAPKCTAVTDCKSVYDVSTKNAPPTCSEYRTMLECLLIRERLQENVSLRWISSQAMLADSLTKSMDGEILRECLRTGRYSLFDETEALKQRATQRERLRWLRGEDKTSMNREGTLDISNV